MSDLDPDHPIIQRAHEYRIRGLRYETGADGQEPFVELHLQRGDEIRRLRFWSPQKFRIEEGFPEPIGGMVIKDVSARQLEGLRVQVADFEAIEGVITFWARDVVDVEDT